jgi:hypothetical protein
MKSTDPTLPALRKSPEMTCHLFASSWQLRYVGYLCRLAARMELHGDLINRIGRKTGIRNLGGAGTPSAILQIFGD